MTNYFDQFDVAPVGGAPSGNVFDRFDPPKTQDVGRGRALAEGARSGVTMNFGDELAGVVAASPLKNQVPTPFNLAGQAMTGLAALGYEYLTGGDEAAKRYAAGRDEIRALQKQAQEQYPGTYTTGQVAGAVAAPVPFGAAVNAATLPARVGRGAAVGAGFGAVSGAGEGENLVDRGSRAVVGAGIGAGVGAVAPAAVEGVVQGGRRALEPMVNAWRGARNVDDEAARRVAIALERDVRADPHAANRLTPTEFAYNSGAQGPATVMDIGGDATRALARSSANTSPEGRGILNRAIDERFEGQSGRVSEYLGGAFNYPDAAATQAALQQSARNVNRGAYARAYRDGSGGLWSPELERLAGSDAVSGAMQSAARKAKDEAIIGGYGAMNPRVTFTQDGQIQFNRGLNGVPTYPDLQYWDLVRRELSDAARNAGGGTSEARRLNSFATALNSELDNLVPSYQAARRGAAQFFGAENALEAGQNFVRQNAPAGEARRALAQMSATERQLFQDGFVSRYVEQINATGDRRNILNQITQSPAAREKIELVLGPQRATELEARLRIEGIMDLARGAVQGNSTTARQLQELGLAGGAYGIGTGFNPLDPNPTALMGAALVYGAARGRNAVNERLAQRVAEMLTSSNPNVILQGVRTVARNQAMLSSLRGADRRIAQAGGGQGAVSGPAVPIQGVTRAEDDKPVPRPPNQ